MGTRGSYTNEERVVDCLAELGHESASLAESGKKCSFRRVDIGLDVSNFTFGIEFAFDCLVIRWDIVLLVEGLVVVISVADNLLVLSYVTMKKVGSLCKNRTCSTVRSSSGPWAK